MSILEKTPKERSLARPSFIRPYVAPLVPFVAAVGLLEWLVDRGSLPIYLVPKPSMVFTALFSERAMLGQAFIQTATAAAVGLGMSLVVGFATAFLLSLSRTLRSAFYPYATFFQTVPIVAIAPLLVIWFGYGLPTVIASAFICSLFPVIASTLLGLQSTDPGLIDLLRIYDTSRFRTLWVCRIPYALPQIFSGVRIASGLAVIGAIVGEFIGGGGLGSAIETARSQQRLDQLFATVMISALLGLFFLLAVNFIARVTLGRWHVSERENAN